MSEEKRLLAILNEQHEWPTVFVFKFIVPADRGGELEALFPEALKLESRPSSGGKYLAYSVHCRLASAEDVLVYYARAHGIPELLSL